MVTAMVMATTMATQLASSLTRSSSCSPTWQGLGFAKDGPYAFKYNFVADNSLWGNYGHCSFTVEAYGDLDDDAVLSRYSIWGSISENGVILGELQAELPGE